MARVKLIVNRGDIAAEHYELFDELAALRGRISGPSTVVLHSPGLARPWNNISEYLHRDSIVEPRFAELAVSVAARESDSGYIWNAHVPLARKAGVTEATLEAVREDRGTAGLPPSEAAMVEFVRQLMRSNRVESAVFDPLLTEHGPQWLVELATWVGRYAALAGVLNGFEVTPEAPKETLPEGTVPASTPPKSVRPPLATPRITPLTKREQVAEAHRGIFDSVAESRGTVRGPFSLLMHSPVLCQRVVDVSNYLRGASVVSQDLWELTAVSTAREKDCPYVWSAHAPAARQAGTSEGAIAAVRDRRPLAGLSDDERDVIQYVREQLRTHRVSQGLFTQLQDRHGTRWLVELTCLMGHYGLVCGILNTCEFAPAPGAEPLPLG